MPQVNLSSINDLQNAVREITHCNSEIHERCKERLSQVEQLLSETEREEQFSNGLLQAAKAAEAIALAAFVATQVNLAKALAEEAAAIASANPIAIAAATADVIQATNAFNQAREAHDMAKKHRELIENRYELAVKCLNLTKAKLEQLRGEFNFSLLAITETSHRGSSRIIAAAHDIANYLSRRQPQAIRYLRTDSAKKNFNKNKLPNEMLEIRDGDEELEEWQKYEPDEREPVFFPKEIRPRLNLNHDAQKALIAFLCADDAKFRMQIDSYRQEAQDPGKRESVELKIRKNMAGRLGEEIVIGALKPYGHAVLTQNRFVTDDGSYTKTDVILQNLKVPVILTKGKGNGAREGQSIAVEVKCGSPRYILSQKGHMEFQAQGHAQCVASCIISSRDIRNISEAAQDELREALRAAGSPIIGALPFKADLDKICIQYVFGG